MEKYNWLKPKLNKSKITFDNYYPLVSIIIPTTRPDFLTRSINSILQQTYQNFEILLIKDGGENINNLIESFNDPRINYFHQEEKKGVSAARNIGLKTAKGKYIAYLDDDDFYYPNHLETLVDFLENNNYQVAYTDAHCSKEVEYKGEWLSHSREIIYCHDFNINALLVRNLFPINTIIHDRKCIFETGFFDEGLATHEDWDFWIRMGLKYPFYHINKTTCAFTIREGNYNSLQRWKGTFWSSFLLIHDRYKKYAIPEIQKRQENERQALAYECLRSLNDIKTKDLTKINLEIILERIINSSYLLSNLTDLYTAYQITFLSINKIPNNHQSYILLARVSRFLGQYDQALEAIEKALELRETKEALSEKIYILEYLDREKATQCQLEFEQKFPQQEKTPKFPQPEPPLNINPINFQEFDVLDWQKNVYNQLKTRKKNLNITENQLIYKPFISIIIPVYNPKEKYLREAIESVINQTYPHWELCIADDASTKPYVRTILTKYAQKDNRIKVIFRQENGHISRASNTALEIATGEYIALLDHDDLLAPNALYEVVKLLNEHPEADMIYSDEVLFNDEYIFSPVIAKADWCPDSFLSSMYTCHLGVYKTLLIKEIGGFRVGYEGSQDYDLVLRFTEKTDKIFHIPKLLYYWRKHPESTNSSYQAKPYAYEAGKKALEEALQRRGEKGVVIHDKNIKGSYKIRYEITNYDLVSIVIPTRDLADILERCLASIFNKTTYPNYEIILLDNGSKETETFTVFDKWKKRQPDRFYCYQYDVPFNYSHINNYAVTKAKGKYLLFLNNDTEVITPNWIQAMVEQAQRPSIGAVGAYLKYPDNTMQHTGVIIARGGLAGNDHVYYDKILNFSAVTGACLMCRREVFAEVGGFDEDIAVAFNDVDLCLKIRERGYYNICLPHVLLYHHESKTRGYEDTPEKIARFEKEVQFMRDKWGELVEQDPCINPVYLNNPKKEHQTSANFTVIVPWWDHTEFLELWQHNLKILKDAEIIFIDNGSQEEGKKDLEEFCQKYSINLIRNEENLGFSAANNQGLKKATKEYILHLNNDISINYLSFVYLAYLAENGIVGPGPAKNELNISYVEGWGLCIKKSILEELGGWNEIYGPGYWDDVDLNHRAKLAGYTITPIPKMSQWIQHITNATGRDGRIDQIALHIANRKKFINQYFSIKPKIIIDGVFFQLFKTGIARVWKSLLEQWANTEFANHIVFLDRMNTAPQIEGIRSRRIGLYNVDNLDGDRQMLQQICDEEDADLFISTYYTIPTATPSVLMIHDMIPELFNGDLNHPHWRGKSEAIKYASHYLCVSQNSAKDLQKIYPEILNSDITISHNGVSECFNPATEEEINNFKHKYGINKPYFLLGNLGVNGYKNSILFFQAFSQLANKTGFDIVATGAGNQFPSEWRQFIAGCTFHPLYLSDEELRLAYAGAVALVYPSKYEGFGMPVAEAMACGCPVITTPNASLPEVGGEAVIYVKDDDIEGMANALCDVQKPRLRHNLIQAGLQQAQKFSWATMAKIFKEALFNAISPQIKLTETTYLIFPDWQSDEETLTEELYNLIYKLAHNSPLSKGGWGGSNPNLEGGGIITLVIDRTGISEEDANLILSGITMSLMMEEELDLENTLDFSLVNNLNEQQWNKLLPKITAKITLENENKEIINQFNFEDLITINSSGNNYAIFPDWKADQEELALEIGKVLMNLSDQENCTLLVNLNNVDQEEVGLFFSEIAMNLMLMEGLELLDNLQINFVNFTASQWQSLGGLINDQVSI